MGIAVISYQWVEGRRERDDRLPKTKTFDLTLKITVIS
ncbi:hypothetical protein VL20_850 [Microcystis panniformis FACHB-1757]|uniref:Uncharacterized protein n=1 Tax=Microcystis panniformis FACHB-1757 TaxID=1638788 RepID=A0A0K1RVY0_9CHRO|nr:hypothetical protein VL20_850 [Microcystis panniformis FACHB-1757]